MEGICEEEPCACQSEVNERGSQTRPPWWIEKDYDSSRTLAGDNCILG